ncbi:MAG: VOC family protein [Candidatus Thermoplasmatota archaeon]
MPTTSSVFLNVSDIEKSITFYRSLGFKVTHQSFDEAEKITTYADLSFRGAELGLGNMAWNDDPDFVEWVRTPLGAGVLIYFTTTGVDAIHEAAKKAGAVIESPPTDRPYGRMFTLNDPDGYVVSFIQETKPRRTVRKTARRAAAKPKSGRTAKAGKRRR